MEGYDTAALTALITHFEEIRSGKTVRMRKNPATAELINWVALLKKGSFPALNINEPEDLKAGEREFLLQSYSVLAKNRDDFRDIQKMVRG